MNKIIWPSDKPRMMFSDLNSGQAFQFKHYDKSQLFLKISGSGQDAVNLGTGKWTVVALTDYVCPVDLVINVEYTVKTER